MDHSQDSKAIIESAKEKFDSKLKEFGMPRPDRDDYFAWCERITFPHCKEEAAATKLAEHLESMHNELMEILAEHRNP